MRWIRLAGRGLLAVLVAAVLGSLVQTQVNLAALASLGLSVEPGLRLQTTALDLLRFAPAWAAIVAGGFLLAFPAAAGLQRRWPGFGWYPLAAAAAVLVALWLMRAVLGLTAIAAARSWAGVLGLAAAAAVGGWVFGRRSRRA